MTTKATILVAESDPTNAQLAEIICECAGCNVLLAANGEEALELASRQSFQVILAEERLRKLDGMNLARRLHKDAKRRGTLMIGLTTNPEPHHIEEMLYAGFDRVLPKPYKAEELRQLLEQALPGLVLPRVQIQHMPPLKKAARAGSPDCS